MHILAADGPIIAVVVPPRAAASRGIHAFVAGLTGMVVGNVIGQLGQPWAEAEVLHPPPRLAVRGPLFAKRHVFLGLFQ